MMLTRLRSFLDQWIISLQTYPIAHIVILIMTIVVMMMIEQEYNSPLMDTLFKILATGAFTLPLTIIKPGSKRWISGAVILGVLYGLVLPDSMQNIVYSQGLWIIGLLFLSWIIPSLILARDHKNDQYLTWSRFGHRWTSFIQGRLGGLILWGGIAASLASIEFLFNVEISSDAYQHVGVITALLIGSWIWLISLESSLIREGDPKGGGFSSLSSQDLGTPGGWKVGVRYPRRIRIFGQYIFLPLCVIYGLILIAYGLKIVVTGQRPEGQLVYMVAGYVGFGLLTWFTLLPLEGTSALLPLERDSSWLSKAYYALFVSFVITSGLMIGALIIRVQQYGWTIDRGLVVALITWIIVMGVGSLIWTQKKWTIGLTSLILLGLASVIIIPPVIKNYHINQLKGQWATLGLNNTPGDNPQAPTLMYQSIDYLAKNYGTGRMSGMLEPKLIDQLSGSSTRDIADNMMSTLGITGYIDEQYQQGFQQEYFYFNVENSATTNNSGYNIEGYKTLIQFYDWNPSDTNNTQQQKYGYLIEDNILQYTNDIVAKSREINPKAYEITTNKAKIIITNANGKPIQNGTGYELTYLNGYLLFK